MRIVVVDEREEWPAARAAIDPPQKVTVQARGILEPEPVLLLQLERFGYGRAERRREQGVHQGTRMIFVMRKTPRETELGGAILDVSNEAGGQIAGRAEGFCEHRMCA